MKDAAPLALKLEPVLNRTQELAHKLSAEIRSGRLSPGSRLPTEQELSATTGVSRTVVREAVAALRADGLVVTRQGLGAFVASDVQQRPFRIDSKELKSRNDIMHILELRMSVEIEAAGLAALRRTETDLAAIATALEDLDRTIASDTRTLEADLRFHLAIFSAARNRYFADFLQFLTHYIMPQQITPVRREGRAQRKISLGRMQKEHRRMFAAICDGDSAAARKATRQHLTNAMRRYEVGECPDLAIPSAR